MSDFTNKRDAVVAWLKANPTFSIALVTFVVGYILGKM